MKASSADTISPDMAIMHIPHDLAGHSFSMNDYKNELYNSLVENSMKVVVLLQAFKHGLAFETIRVLELVAVYGEDIGHGKSLQSRSDGRYRAYAFRGTMLREAIGFLASAGIVVGDEDAGYRLAITDLFHPDSFTGCLGSDFDRELEVVCDLMASKAVEEGHEAFVSRMTSMVLAGQNAELGEVPSAIETPWMVEQLERDFWRMEAVSWTAGALAERAESLPPGLHGKLDVGWLTGLVEAARAEMRRISSDQRRLAGFRASLGYTD